MHVHDVGTLLLSFMCLASPNVNRQTRSRITRADVKARKIMRKPSSHLSSRKRTGLTEVPGAAGLNAGS